jgi:hypothetical protein
MRVSPAVVVLGHHLWVYGGVDLVPRVEGRLAAADAPCVLVSTFFVRQVAQEYLSDVWLLDLQVIAIA